MLSNYQRSPAWLRDAVKVAKSHPNETVYQNVSERLAVHQINTVCHSAGCPNRGQCFASGMATFMVLGDICTRNCRFCAVTSGRPQPPDIDEARRIAAFVHELNLQYVVITSVTRDDLPDGGAAHYLRVVEALRALPSPPCIELLVPDFQGSVQAIDQIVQMEPEVIGHNMETVARLYHSVRPGAEYPRSLSLLEKVDKQASHHTVLKSGFMLGLGETDSEVMDLLNDLRDAGVQSLTIGQYLAPSIRHLPVDVYVDPEKFQDWAEKARAIGFATVVSGPLVRSSYHAAQSYADMKRKRADG